MIAIEMTIARAVARAHLITIAAIITAVIEGVVMNAAEVVPIRRVCILTTKSCIIY